MAYRARRTGSTTARGYGTPHQKLRAELLAQLTALGSMTCPRCLHPILPGMAVDLGHTADRTAYVGLEHAHCNRADGARRGNRSRTRTRRAQTRPIVAVDPRTL